LEEDPRPSFIRAGKKTLAGEVGAIKGNWFNGPDELSGKRTERGSGSQSCRSIIISEIPGVTLQIRRTILFSITFLVTLYEEKKTIYLVIVTNL
jgi:hypothetical protein